MTTAAFVVALLALVVSILSVSWQVWTWRHDGPVVKVTGAFGLLFEPETNLIVVTVSNAGRSPVTVTGYGLALPHKGGNFVPLRPPPYTATVPHRLEPGDDVSFHMLRHEVERTVAEHGGSAEVRPFARLGTGQTARGKKPFHIEAPTFD